MTELLIVRHGRTPANAAGLKQGTINTPQTYLSEVGRAQATELAAHLDLGGASALYVSPLERTRQTAAILNAQAQLPVIEDAHLLEISYGQWDGQLNADLMAQYPEHFYPLIEDVKPSYATVAGGESFTAVQARVKSFTDEIAQAHPTEQVVVVTHGFTVRSFAANVVNCQALEILEPANCSVSKIIIDPTTHEQHLVYYNRTATISF